MPIEDAKSLVHLWLSADDSPVHIKRAMITDVFARFYRVPTSIFTKIERSAVRIDSLKEARSALKKIQQETSESNEANDVVTSIDAFTKNMAEKLSLGEMLLWRRESVKNWKIIRPKLSEVGIKTDEVDEVIGNWGIQAYVRSYIVHSASFLHSLERDIMLVVTVEASDWNPSILKEVLDLMCFLYGLFETVSDGSRFPKDAGEDLDSALDGVELAWFNLFQRNSENPRNMALILQCKQDAGKDFSGRFPAIKELWILNELSRRALSGGLMLNRRSGTEEKKKRRISSALEEIRAELRDFNEEFEEAYDENLTWTPKTIAIVLDLETGFLLTGASQMSCKGHSLFRQLVKEIPCLQIGATFESVIAQCNEDWIGKYELLYGEGYEMRKRILQEEQRLQLQEYAQLPTQKGALKIFCWAVSGFTLEAKSPCPRCAYFYPSWDMEKCEDYMQPEYFDKYFRGKTNNLKKNYCAETIAAAAIYAWRESKLALD